MFCEKIDLATSRRKLIGKSPTAERDRLETSHHKVQGLRQGRQASSIELSVLLRVGPRPVCLSFRLAPPQLAPLLRAQPLIRQTPHAEELGCIVHRSLTTLPIALPSVPPSCGHARRGIMPTIAPYVSGPRWATVGAATKVTSYANRACLNCVRRRRQAFLAGEPTILIGDGGNLRASVCSFHAQVVGGGRRRTRGRSVP